MEILLFLFDSFLFEFLAVNPVFVCFLLSFLRHEVDRENRVSLVASKRVSWKRSLSIRLGLITLESSLLFTLPLMNCLSGKVELKNPTPDDMMAICQ